MPVGFPSHFELCSIASLPNVHDGLVPRQVRVLGRVVGTNPQEGVVLLADPAYSPASTIVVECERVILQGGVLPPKSKDLVMVFGELVQREMNSTQIPRKDIHMLTVQNPPLNTAIVASRLVRIEEGHGAGFDVQSWSQAVDDLKDRLATR